MRLNPVAQILNFESNFESDFKSDSVADFGSDNLISLSNLVAAFSVNLFRLSQLRSVSYIILDSTLASTL